MALLADTINDGKGPQPILEKIRCLGAIREMIKLSKNHVSNGLPQVRVPLSTDLTTANVAHRYVHVYGQPSKTKTFLIKALMRGSS